MDLTAKPDYEPDPGTDAPGGDPEGRRRVMARAVVLIGAFFFLLIIFSCREMRREEQAPLAYFPGRIGRAPVVRMAVRRKATAVRVSVRGGYEVLDAEDAVVASSSRKLSGAFCSFDGRRLWLGDLAMSANGKSMARMRIRPRDLGSLEVDHKVYPGDVEFIGVPRTRTLHCVIHMNIEEYICGVLSGEVPVDKWHDQALRAQAVASRTYAMYYHLINRSKAWDFGRTGMEAQQYKPGIVRNSRVNRAVNSTSGQILTWQNRVFPAYFHSSCGGHTLDSSMVFNRVSIKPLSGVPCKWCGDPKLNKYAHWKKTYSMGTIAHRLDRAAGRMPELHKLRGKGGLRALEIADSTEDGRITRFRVRVHLSPGSYDFWANDIRMAMGPNDLRSTKCKMTSSRGRYYFEGSGWGHGVGLCQWGSLAMARAGYDYQDILTHYYPYSRLFRMSYDESGKTAVTSGSGSRPREVRSVPREHKRPVSGKPARKQVRREADGKARGGQKAKG